MVDLSSVSSPMSDITKIKDIIAKLGEAEALLQSSDISEEHKKELHDILAACAENPLNYQDIYYKKTISYSKQFKTRIPKKITVKLSLEEQKKDILSALYAIRDNIPAFQTQLLAMKGAGYFRVEEQTTNYERTRIRKPGKGQIGDMGLYNDHPTEVVYHKKIFTDTEIDTTFFALLRLNEEISGFLPEIEALNYEGIFAKDNITKVQGLGENRKKVLFEIYRLINGKLLPGELSDDVFKKKYPYNSEERKAIWSTIRNRIMLFADQAMYLSAQESAGDKTKERNPFNVIKPQEQLFHVPAMKELMAHSLTNTKEIDNPDYSIRSEGWLAMAYLAKELAKILLPATENG